MSKKLTKEEILHIAKLANLSLSDDEIERYSTQLSEILKYVEKLGEVNTENVEPMTHTIDAKNVMFDDGEENKRAGFDAKKLHSQQKDGKTYFKVERIM